MASFDPYQQWLGIPSQMRPLNHYILLGLRIFEVDSQKVTAAYEARMELLRTVQAGPRGELAHQVISEIGLAKRDLMDPDRKSKYDVELKDLLNKRQRELEHAQDDAAAQKPGNMPADSQSVANESFPVLVPSDDSEAPIAAVTIQSTQPDQLQSIAQARSEDLPGESDEDDSGVLSVFSYLTDVRYLVGLLVVSVIVMTATVKLLSPSSEQEKESQTLPLVQGNENEPAKVEAAQAEDPIAKLARVAQGADASFELSVQGGQLTGSEVKIGPQGISGWNAGDEAVWVLVAKQRRTGYFNCLITYRAKSESVFQVQLGNSKPRLVTLYPHDDDFEEEFIVRLAKSSKKTGEQTFRIKATQTGANEVEIKRIRLVPNR